MGWVGWVGVRVCGCAGERVCGCAGVRVCGGVQKKLILMVGSRRLGGVTNLESDKHAGKPGAFATCGRPLDSGLSALPAARQVDAHGLAHRRDEQVQELRHRVRDGRRGRVVALLGVLRQLVEVRREHLRAAL